MLTERVVTFAPDPPPLSPEAIRLGCERIREQMGLPPDFSDVWNKRMDQFGARRGTWDELKAVLSW